MRDIKVIKRRLDRIELYAPFNPSKHGETTRLLREMEEQQKTVARMSEEEKRELAQQIDHDARTAPLTPDMEPFRDVLGRATLRNLGLSKFVVGAVQ